MSPGASRVARILEERGVRFELRSFPDTSTAELAARSLGVELGSIVKTLLFRRKEDGKLFAVLVSGDRRLDNRRLREMAGGRVEMVPGDEVLRLTGYPPGGLSPVGLPEEVEVVFDVSLDRFEVLHAGGGDERTMLSIAKDDLFAICGGEMALLHREGD